MTYEDALILACRAHAGQRYGTEPYVHHPLRVAARVLRDEEKLTALLHDVLEDSSMTAADLRVYRVPASVVGAVVILTRDKDRETYAEYISRVCDAPGSAGRLARIVKRADLEENLSQQFGEGTLRVRYLRALERLAEKDFGPAE